MQLRLIFSVIDGFFHSLALLQAFIIEVTTSITDELKPLVQYTISKAVEARTIVLKKDNDVDMASGATESLV